ncbi:MAG: hypothetical protein HY329_18870, partial [Chloroflexi bacterium]|nr:hypothetical protein [Chloroflexota bacterium]
AWLATVGTGWAAEPVEGLAGFAAVVGVLPAGAAVAAADPPALGPGAGAPPHPATNATIVMSCNNRLIRGISFALQSGE